MSTPAVESTGFSTCPDCGTSLNFTLPGFRPATADERRRLTTDTVRVLGLCPNPWCPEQAPPC